MPQPIRILYADGNPFDRELVRNTLETAEDTFALAEATSRSEFENLLQTEQFDLVLSDFNIAGFEGLAVIDAVRAADPHLPVILITGSGSEEVAVQALKQGADDYIIKTPAHIRRLPYTIRTVLERKHLQQEKEAAQRELSRRNRELTLLNRVIAACMTQTDIESILATICQEMSLALDAPHTAAALLNRAKTEALVVAEHRADDRPSVLNQIVPIAKSPAYRLLLVKKTPLLVADARTDDRLAPMRRAMAKHSWVSLIILPLVVNNEVLGSLGLSRPEPNSFTTEDLELAWSVAEQVSGALAHARAEQERRLLATAIEQAAESIVITDPTGTILYVNPAFESVTGYTRAEAVGRNPRILKSGRQDPEFYRQLWHTITAGQVWRGKFINKHKDGSLFTEEATITPVHDANGRITHFVGVKRNITREEQLEAQFRQAQKMEALGRLTGGITHDFNNILTAINGFAELLKMRLPPDDLRLPLVEKILQSGQSATELVSQLLTFSRKDTQTLQVVNLNAIIKQTEGMLRRVIGEDVRLQTVLAADLWAVRANPAHIRQVIMNLVINARDAMPDGGELTIETDNVVLDSDYVAQHLDTRPGEYILLAVTDTGIGMSKDVQEHIFEPFFTTKQQGQGTGLGLSTVFGIVKQSGGNIWVYSEKGKGTTIKIYLPRTAETEAFSEGVENTMPEEGAYSGDETILLVEDNPGVRQLARQVLESQGYTVLESAAGDEALVMADAYEGVIHLLLTDVVMPGLSGKALAEALEKRRPAVKVLYMSGYTQNTIVYRGVLDAGAMLLQKPFSTNRLLRTVRKILDGEDIG